MSTEKQVIQDWFEVWEAEPGLFAIHEPFHSERVYSYLVVGSALALLVDSGTGAGDIRAVVDELTALPVVLLNSHAHWDHIGGNWRFNEIWIHEAEASDLEWKRDNAYLRRWFSPAHLTSDLPYGFSAETIEIPASRATRTLTGGERINLGDRELLVIHAPGHSAGGLVLLDTEHQFMLSTDVVYAGSLYAFNDDSSIDDYRATLMTLDEIAPSLRTIYPSHDESPIGPELIPRMRDAMDEIADGREPDSVQNGRATYAFDGFGVITKSPLDRGANG